MINLCGIMNILDMVRDERAKQDVKWGTQDHPDFAPNTEDRTRGLYAELADEWKAGNDRLVADQSSKGVPSDRNCAWDGILMEEVLEALGEADEDKKIVELVQVAAVCVAWIEAIERRGAK